MKHVRVQILDGATGKVKREARPPELTSSEGEGPNRVAHFDDAVPGPQMMIRYQGHQPEVMLVGVDGKVIRRFTLNDSPNHTGMEVVFWDGPDQAAYLYNGGVLWSGQGNAAHRFTELPTPFGSPRQGWYHCIPANLCGDAREEVVVYNPWDRFVYVYTPYPFVENSFSGYHPGPRQYNVRLVNYCQLKHGSFRTNARSNDPR